MPTSTHLLVRKKSAGAHGRLCSEHAGCKQTSRFDVNILGEYHLLVIWQIVKLVSENKTVDIQRCASLTRQKMHYSVSFSESAFTCESSKPNGSRRKTKISGILFSALRRTHQHNVLCWSIHL